MTTEKSQIIPTRIISVGGETDLSEPVMNEVPKSNGVSDLDMDGFVPASDELDLSDLTPAKMETMRIFLTPAQRKLRSISSQLSFHAIKMTQRVGEAIDALDAISGPGWFRPPVPAERLRGIIDRYRRRVVEIVDTNYVELLLTQAQDLWKSNDHDKWEEAKGKRIKALVAPYEAARMAYEAARLEAALKEGRPVPGGLLDIQLGGRAAYGIPDLHGNEWGWWRIWDTPLDDGMTLKQKFHDGDHVFGLGDAVHPDFEPLDHWAPSENIMNEIFGLARHRPNPLWYTPGNHDVFYGGGEDAPIKGDTLQGILFRDHLIEKRGLTYVRSAQAFIDRSPFFIRSMHGDEVIAAAAHSSIIFDGMTPEDAIIAPYDPILRYELTWNRPFKRRPKKSTKQDSDKPIKQGLDTSYKPADVVAMRKKIGSPHTIFFSGHSDQEIASFYHPKKMPGHIIGLATAAYNDELAILKITADSVEVININGKAALSGRNLREEFKNSQGEGGRFKLLDFWPRKGSRDKAVGGDPLKKPGGNGPVNYKQDPGEVSRALSNRSTHGDLTSPVDEWTESMLSKGSWFGSVNDTPLIITSDGETFKIFGIFGSSIEGDAGEILGATDEVIVEKRDPKSKKPLRLLLRDCPTFIGPLTIFKSGKYLSVDTGAQKGSGIASGAALYLKHTDDGQARHTVHDPDSIGMRPTEIPEPTRISRSTAMPPPPPNGKPGGNGPCDYRSGMYGNPCREEMGAVFTYGMGASQAAAVSSLTMRSYVASSMLMI